MVLQGVFKSSWICLLLFSIAACAPAKKGHLNAGYFSGGSGSRRVRPGSDGASFGFTSGVGSNVGSPAAQDAGISQMIAGLMGLRPYGSRPLLQFHWSSPQVPLDMVEKRPVYPSSLIIHSNNGYQRARDFRSDSKYTKETFDNIPQPGAPQNPDSGSKGQQRL
uniref:Uncharacterized protein n=1 Tax=Fundulus heteroclitus TaxID=8078 RepID=A0A3Q2PLI9_FUNHE